MLRYASYGVRVWAANSAGASCGVDAAYTWIACGGGPVAVLSWACGRVAVLIQWLLGLWPS